MQVIYGGFLLCSPRITGERADCPSGCHQGTRTAVLQQQIGFGNKEDHIWFGTQGKIWFGNHGHIWFGNQDPMWLGNQIRFGLVIKRSDLVW